MTARSLTTPIVLGVLGLAYAGLVSACSWLTPNHVHDVASITTCVLNHRYQPVLKIAETCAIEDVAEIVDILTVYKATARKDGAWFPDPPEPANSADAGGGQ